MYTIASVCTEQIAEAILPRCPGFAADCASAAVRTARTHPTAGAPSLTRRLQEQVLVASRVRRGWSRDQPCLTGTRRLLQVVLKNGGVTARGACCTRRSGTNSRVSRHILADQARVGEGEKLERGAGQARPAEPAAAVSSSLALLPVGPVAAARVPSLQWECRFIASGCKLAHHVMLG